MFGVPDNLIWGGGVFVQRSNNGPISYIMKHHSSTLKKEVVIDQAKSSEKPEGLLTIGLVSPFSPERLGCLRP